MSLSVKLEPLDAGEDISAIKYFVVPLSMPKHRKIAEATERSFDPEAPFETARIIAGALNACFDMQGNLNSIALHRMPDRDYALLAYGDDFDQMRQVNSIAEEQIMQVSLRQASDGLTWLAKCQPLPEQWRHMLLASKNLSEVLLKRKTINNTCAVLARNQRVDAEKG